MRSGVELPYSETLQFCNIQTLDLSLSVPNAVPPTAGFIVLLSVLAGRDLGAGTDAAAAVIAAAAAATGGGGAGVVVSAMRESRLNHRALTLWICCCCFFAVRMIELCPATN